MANEEQLAILKQGVEVWNKWREEKRETRVDLTGADLSQANLSSAALSYAALSDADLRGADLSGADLYYAELVGASLRGAHLTGANLSKAYVKTAHLTGADIRKANLREADLWGADLGEADLSGADLHKANLRGANLRDANLRGARLRQADLGGANLRGADLRGAVLAGARLNDAHLMGANLGEVDLSGANLFKAELREADLRGADLTGSSLVQADITNAKISKSNVYGVSVWDLEGEFQEQKDLIITPWNQPSITVDNIKVAQFIYLILNNKEIRDVINTLTSKSVLILGRFADDERKAVLNALRDKLREYNLLPIVFDFDRPIDRNITETVRTLAAISYFVIADVTSPKSSPLELQAIVPNFQIPVVPIIQEEELPFSMIADLQSQYNGVLDPLTYHSEETLIQSLKAAVIDPAIEKYHELRLIKAQRHKIRRAEDFIEDKGLDNQST